MRHRPGPAPVAALLVLGLAAAGPACAATPAPDPGRSRFDHFITRDGARLLEGPREFRFMGANMPGLVLPYDFTLRQPHRMTLPTPWEQEDAFRTLDQMNLRVVRLWNLPVRGPQEEARPWHYVLGPGQFNESAFVALDHVLALANRYGVRVIVDFTAGSGDYLGGVGTYAAHRGKKRAEFFTDPQCKEDYQATVRYVIGRRNTVTGVPYREDKAILAWQHGNEIQEAPEAWVSEMAAYLKRLDPNHLVMDTRHRSVPDPSRVDPHIDIYTRHYYDSYGKDRWSPAVRKELKALAGRRPFVVGEYGPYIGGPSGTEAVLANHREFLETCIAEGVSGALLWSMYFHRQDGGFYWHQIFTFPSVWSFHWPGFPSADAQKEIEILADLRSAAFRIQGLPVPPLPVPEPPAMLPPGDRPLLSWRGSAGARGYDLERAPAREGPWTRIAANVSDADVAYRPLYNDATAKPGAAYFYRAIARNESGTSAPSDPVGPVRFKTACLVDEFPDLSRVHARSDGLSIDNTFNAMYDERLFRACGEAGAWVAYRVEGAIRRVAVSAWFQGKPADLAIQASVDGETYTEVAASRVETPFPSPPGGAAKGARRTRVEYEAAPPGDPRYLKILWTGPASVDRVEIDHAGAP